MDGEYQPIEIVQLDETHYYGRSDVLGLDLCWEEGLLRWWDPAKERYLSTFNEEADGRITAESDRDAAQVERDAERGVRIAPRERVGRRTPGPPSRRKPRPRTRSGT